MFSRRHSKRRPMTKRHSRKTFHKGMRHHSRNRRPMMRGGYRI